MPNAWFFSELASPEAEIPVWLLSSGQQGSRLPVPCSSGDVLIHRDRCLGFILCFVELKHPNGFPQVSRCWEGCTLLGTLGKSVFFLPVPASESCLHPLALRWISTVPISVPVDRQQGWGKKKSCIRDANGGKAKLGGCFRVTSKGENGFCLVGDWLPRTEMK